MFDLYHKVYLIMSRDKMMF